MKKLLVCAVAGLALAAASNASANTMTFSGLSDSIEGPGTYVEDGISVTSESGLFWGWPSAGQLHMDPSGFAGNTNTFTMGGVFDAVSVDISYESDGTLTFYGYDASDTLLMSQAFSSPTGTLDLSAFAGISSLKMVDTGSHISVDNFVANLAGAVPEPMTWALMVAGFGVVGASMRRRSTAVSFA